MMRICEREQTNKYNTTEQGDWCLALNLLIRCYYNFCFHSLQFLSSTIFGCFFAFPQSSIFSLLLISASVAFQHMLFGCLGGFSFLLDSLFDLSSSLELNSNSNSLFFESCSPHSLNRSVRSLRLFASPRNVLINFTPEIEFLLTRSSKH